jgi:hypothetical protein
VVVYAYKQNAQEMERIMRSRSPVYTVRPCLKKKRPGVVAHAYNPGYSGSGDWEDYGVEAAGQKVQETPSQPIKKLGMVPYTCHSSYVGNLNRRTAVRLARI